MDSGLFYRQLNFDIGRNQPGMTIVDKMLVAFVANGKSQLEQYRTKYDN